jgi:hypothetical protein
MQQRLRMSRNGGKNYEKLASERASEAFFFIKLIKLPSSEAALSMHTQKDASR